MNYQIKTPAIEGNSMVGAEEGEHLVQNGYGTPAEVEVQVPCVRRPRLHRELTALWPGEPFMVCGEDGEPSYMVLEVKS